ncbi:hypothetical protein TNCV_294451 [Trichonephila clavipes]|nr:hypothetical protein TNCV_294451 [Trichonephila clavipes]
MSECRECQKNIPPDQNAPPPACIILAMVAGCLLSEVSHRTLQRPSFQWIIKLDSSENDTFRHSVDIQLRYPRVNSSHRFQ